MDRGSLNPKLQVPHRLKGKQICFFSIPNAKTYTLYWEIFVIIRFASEERLFLESQWIDNSLKYFFPHIFLNNNNNYIKFFYITPKQILAIWLEDCPSRDSK